MMGEPPHTVSDKYEISQLLFFPLLHPSFLLALSLSLALSSFNFPSHFPAPTNDVAIRIMDNEMGYLLLPGDRTVESQCPSPPEKMSSVCARVPVVLEMKEREREGSVEEEEAEEVMKEKQKTNTYMEIMLWAPDRHRILLR